MKKVAFLFCFFLASCSSLEQKEDIQKKGPEKSLPKKVKLKEKIGPNLDEVLRAKVDEAKRGGKDAIYVLEGELFLKGSDASFRSDYRSSIIYFKYLLELQPNDPYVKKRYGIELIKLGKLGTAKTQLEELYKQKGNYSNIGLILGGLYNSLGEKDKAETVYLEIIKKGGERIVEACLLLVKSYQIRKKYKESKRTLKYCEDRSNRKELFLYYRGKIALERGKNKKAKKYFEMSLKKNPRYYLAVIELGKFLEKENKLSKVLELYENYLKDNPMAYPILTRTVNILLRLGKKARAIPYVENLTRIDPSDLNLKLRLGLFYIDVKRYEDSKIIFKELLQEVPNSPKVLFHLGVLYRKTNKLDEAILHFSKIKKDNTYFKESVIQVANILMEKAIPYGKELSHPTVIAFLDFSKKKSKEYRFLKLELMSLVSNYYENLRQFGKSIAVLESLKNESGFGENHEYYLASLYEKNSEFKKARVVITNILKKNPNNPHALNFLGYSMLERNENLPLAFKYILKAVKLRPKDGYIRDSLGWYYFKVGKISKALKEIKKAWALVKSDFIIAKHLAAIYMKKKNYRMAVKFYKEALKVSKTEEERKEVAGLIKTLQDKYIGASPKRLPASK